MNFCLRNNSRNLLGPSFYATVDLSHNTAQFSFLYTNTFSFLCRFHFPTSWGNYKLTLPWLPVMAAIIVFLVRNDAIFIHAFNFSFLFFVCLFFINSVFNLNLNYLQYNEYSNSRCMCVHMHVEDLLFVNKWTLIKSFKVQMFIIKSEKKRFKQWCLN